MMGVLLVICAGLLVGRSLLLSESRMPVTEVVEVRGAVPRPGYHPVVRPVTVSAAVQAAGGSSTDESMVPPGSVVQVGPDGAGVAPMTRRLVFGLPIEINTATREGLASVPGIGPSRAEAILESRTDRGPFGSVDGLTRVKGIGPGTVERIRPFVTVE
jgi:competence ComEA-like helix-hairpin-helix protein